MINLLFKNRFVFFRGMRRGQIKNINFGIKIYENEKDTCSDLKKKRNKNHVSMMF